MRINVTVERIRNGRVVGRHVARNTITADALLWAAGKLVGGFGPVFTDPVSVRIYDASDTLLKTLSTNRALSGTNARMTAVALDDNSAAPMVYTPSYVQIWLGSSPTIQLSEVAAADFTPALVAKVADEHLRITYELTVTYVGRVIPNANNIIFESGNQTVVTATVAQHLFAVLVGTIATKLTSTQLDVYSKQQPVGGDPAEYAPIAVPAAAVTGTAGSDNISYVFTVPAATESSDELRKRALVWKSSGTGAEAINLASYDWGERPQGSSTETESLTLTLTIDEP